MSWFKKESILRDYILMMLAMTLSAMCYNLFLNPLDIVAGGTGGVATILRELFNYEVSISILVQDIGFLIISRIFLGKAKAKATIFVCIMYPLMVRLTMPISSLLVINSEDMFINIIFGAVINGISNGIVYKIGFNTGGFSVISQVLQEKCNISIAKSIFIINTIIVTIGGMVFNYTNAMFAIIYLFISKLIMDKIILGISNNKAIYIVTSEPKKINNYIMETLNHSTTSFEVKGGVLEKRKEAILTVIPTRDYYKLREGVRMIDNKAFFIATDSYEAQGAD